MRHTIIVATLSSVAASVLTTAIISGSLFGAGTASSANTQAEAASVVSPGAVESILQGDINCDGFVDAQDALGALRYVAELDVQQEEPCPDVGTLATIPGTPGISGYEIVRETNVGSCVTVCTIMTTATCPPGKKALGGGSLYSGSDGQFENLGSGPSNESAWGTQWYLDGASFYDFRDAVVCANVAD